MIEIVVNREDLKGKYLNSYECPISRACKRHFNTQHIFTRPHIVQVKQDKEYVNYKLRAIDDWKARFRAGNSLWGRIIGGFTVKLEEI